MFIYGTKLTIKNLEIHDKGFYKCEAFNGEEKVDSTGILIVKLAMWREYPAVLSVCVCGPQQSSYAISWFPVRKVGAVMGRNFVSNNEMGRCPYFIHYDLFSQLSV